MIALHGFTQNTRCWGMFGELLETLGPVTYVDAPGHGRSGNDDADLWETAELIADATPPGLVIGYSMGGRMALHLALAHPEHVTGLVLIGATAGIRDEAERKERRLADARLATSLVEDLPNFVDRWLEGPLFSGLTTATNFRTERLSNRAAGLAGSLRKSGTGSQEDLWVRLADITVPVLLLSGARDPKFTDVCANMSWRFGGPATHDVIKNVGHSVHLEAPDETFAAISQWLSRD